MFTLAQPRVVERAHIEGTGRTRVAFVSRSDYWGTFASRDAAKRAYAEQMEPDLKGAPDAWIARHFAVWSRNGEVRLIRVPRGNH